MISRDRKGTDGRTAWELRHGRPYRRELAMFGERILYQPSGKRPSRLDPRFTPGIFFGVVEGSEEILVGTDQGVVKARSFKRLPADGRADPAAFWALI